jgi:hypothetical protein
VLEDVGAKKFDLIMQIAREYSLARLKLNYRKGIYELEDHVGEEALNLNLLPKVKLVTKIPFTSFPSCLVENI